jgi:Spy/CpxP family protein refolding chaperone
MRMRRRAAIVLATFALAIAVPASAGDGPGRHGGKRPGIERVLERHAERLALDDATREAIRERASQGREAADAEREALRALHREMRELLSQELPDEARVLEQADAIGRVETALQKHRLRTMLAIRALLSPEQRRELVRIHEEMRAERGERRERGREHWRRRRGEE